MPLKRTQKRIAKRKSAGDRSLLSQGFEISKLKFKTLKTKREGKSATKLAKKFKPVAGKTSSIRDSRIRKGMLKDKITKHFKKVEKRRKRRIIK